jgi:hypothetical protein
MPYIQYVELVYEMYRRLIAEQKANERASKSSKQQGSSAPTAEQIKNIQK